MFNWIKRIKNSEEALLHLSEGFDDIVGKVTELEIKMKVAIATIEGLEKKLEEFQKNVLEAAHRVLDEREKKREENNKGRHKR